MSAIQSGWALYIKRNDETVWMPMVGFMEGDTTNPIGIHETQASAEADLRKLQKTAPANVELRVGPYPESSPDPS